MDELSREDLLDLISRRNDYSLSIFMPTARIGQEVQQNSIRLKNLIEQAEFRLHQAGNRPGEVKEFLAPIQALVDNGEFWQSQSDGLAVFRSVDFFRALRLPIDFDEMVYLNDRFYIKQLIPMLEDNGSYYLLALGIKNVRLFETDRFGIREVSLGETPTSMDKALGYDTIQSHIRRHASAKQSNRGQSQAMVYGEGESNNDIKKGDILRFFQMLDKGVYKQIGGGSNPLVLAGVEYLLPIYRETNSYPHIFEASIPENVETRRPQELHAEVWPIISPFYEQAKKGAVDAYHILKNQKQASSDIAEIVPAAFFGQVDILLISPDLRIWGQFDRDRSSVTIHKSQERGDEDLTDLAAAYTLSNNGTVYTFSPSEIPDGALIAATLRWPIKGLSYEKKNKD
jgi:hypothetical protein